MFSLSLFSRLQSLGHRCEVISPGLDNLKHSPEVRELRSDWVTYILRLQGNHGTVRVGNQRGDGDGGESVGSKVRVGGDKVLRLSLPLLTAVNQGCWRVNVGRPSQGNPGAVSSLGGVVLGGGQGYVGVERSHSTVRVGHQSISSENLGLGRALSRLNKMMRNIAVQSGPSYP